MDGWFSSRCNLDTVTLEQLESEDLREVKDMVHNHAAYTHSKRAGQVLSKWNEVAPKFVKVMPKDFRRMLDAIGQAEKSGLAGEEAIMAAFEVNKNDAARISGS
jgi:glutamate synthase (ferredoxin)